MSVAALYERRRYLQGALELPDTGCHLWSARISDVRHRLPQFGEVLSLDEAQRAARYRFSRPRACFVAARTMLRCVLSRYLDMEASQLRFDHDEGGKPSLAVRQSRGICFNLAHSGDLILLAVARRRAVGVDMEHVRPLTMNSVLRQFFSEGERDALAVCDPRHRHIALLSLWTCKEAYGKARGVGLRPPILKLDEALATDGGVEVLPERWSHSESGVTWHVQRPFIAEGYVAAVVVGGNLEGARPAPDFERFAFEL